MVRAWQVHIKTMSFQSWTIQSQWKTHFFLFRTVSLTCVFANCYAFDKCVSQTYGKFSWKGLVLVAGQFVWNINNFDFTAMSTPKVPDIQFYCIRVACKSFSSLKTHACSMWMKQPRSKDEYEKCASIGTNVSNPIDAINNDVATIQKKLCVHTYWNWALAFCLYSPNRLQ